MGSFTDNRNDPGDEEGGTVSNHFDRMLDLWHGECLNKAVAAK